MRRLGLRRLETVRQKGLSSQYHGHKYHHGDDAFRICQRAGSGSYHSRRDVEFWRTRKQRDQARRDGGCVVARRQFVGYRCDQRTQSPDRILARQAGQFSCLPPGIDILSRQHRENAEKHAVAAFANWREEKRVELASELRSRIRHITHILCKNVERRPGPGSSLSQHVERDIGSPRIVCVARKQKHLSRSPPSGDRMRAVAGEDVFCIGPVQSN